MEITKEEMTKIVKDAFVEAKALEVTNVLKERNEELKAYCTELNEENTALFGKIQRWEELAASVIEAYDLFEPKYNYDPSAKGRFFALLQAVHKMRAFLAEN